MKLYREQNIEGEPPFVEAGLFDICEWVVEAYPEDIFPTSKPKPRDKGIMAVVAMRTQCRKILRLK